MADRFIVSEVARLTGFPPRDISDLFYHRLIADDEAPVISGRRLIPGSLIPRIVQLLEARSAKRTGEHAHHSTNESPA